MKKFLGKVTNAEMEELRTIQMRKNALRELMQSLSPANAELYEKIVSDLTETNQKTGDWWKQISARYQWKFDPSDAWQLDYETCEMHLIVPDAQ